jgi:spore germination protein YaaH
VRILAILLCLLCLGPESSLARKAVKPVLPPVPVLTGKVNLVWQHKNLPDVDLANIPTVEGLNVVSPCWYEIEDATGKLKDKSVEEYCLNARRKSYLVWPLITSSFNPEMFHQVLENSQARQFVITQLIDAAHKHNFDGINLDFENIRDTDKDKLTSFVAELTKALHKEKLTVSMDVTTPSGAPYWSNCYDRKALAENVDYMMLMAYDQYTPSMHKAGPTAALDWVEKGLQATLTQVPAKKLVLGIPLYMRIWEEDLTTHKVTGKTLSMSNAEKVTTAKSILPSWKGVYWEKKALLECSYEENDKRYTYWLEDANSIRRKAALVKQYDLAGVASWRKGFETPDVWPVLAAAVK